MTDQKNGQEYLSFVLEKLQARLAEISQSLLDGQKEIENMHDYYWQNYTEMDQYGYEDYDNQQALLHQVNANQEQLLLRSRFRKMLDSPFFGRVDFCYDGDDEPEIFYRHRQFCGAAGRAAADLRLEKPGQRSFLRF